MRHPTPWVSQLYCKSVHISLILSLFEDSFHFLTFKKLVFKVCLYLVGSPWDVFTVPVNHPCFQGCYIVGLGLNCKFIDLLFKRSVINFIEISSLVGFIVSEIIYSQTDTLTEELMDLR